MGHRGGNGEHWRQATEQSAHYKQLTNPGFYWQLAQVPTKQTKTTCTTTTALVVTPLKRTPPQRQTAFFFKAGNEDRSSHCKHYTYLPSEVSSSFAFRAPILCSRASALLTASASGACNALDKNAATLGRPSDLICKHKPSSGVRNISAAWYSSNCECFSIVYRCRHTCKISHVVHASVGNFVGI